MTKPRKYPILFKSMVPKIDVRNSVAKKIYAGELTFEFEAEQDLLDIPYVSFDSPVRAELKFEIFQDDSVEVKGRIAYVLKGLCSRCLGEAEQEIVFEAEGVFVATEPEDEEYSYRNGRVDLSEFLRDCVAFSLPQRLLCDDCAEQE